MNPGREKDAVPAIREIAGPPGTGHVYGGLHDPGKVVRAQIPDKGIFRIACVFQDKVEMCVGIDIHGGTRGNVLQSLYLYRGHNCKYKIVRVPAGQVESGTKTMQTKPGSLQGRSAGG